MHGVDLLFYAYVVQEVVSFNSELFATNNSGDRSRSSGRYLLTSHFAISVLTSRELPYAAGYAKQLKAEVGLASANAAKGKKLLDKLKAEEDALKKSNPKSSRLQAYKSHYLRLCASYVAAMKEHQAAKVSTIRPHLWPVSRAPYFHIAFDCVSVVEDADC